MYKKRYTRVDIDSILASLKSKYRLSQEVILMVEGFSLIILRPNINKLIGK